MAKLKLRYHFAMPRITKVFMRIDETKLAKEGRNVPPNLTIEGISNEIFIYDQSGNPIKSWLQIINELPVNLPALSKDADLGKSLPRFQIFENIAIRHEIYGLIPLKEMAVEYAIDIETKEATNLGRAIGDKVFDDLRMGRLMEFNPSGGPARPAHVLEAANLTTGPPKLGTPTLRITKPD
jgi:hypothetical protein